MPNQLPSLVEPILRDDRGKVQKLRNQNSALARATAMGASYETNITQWEYAEGYGIAGRRRRLSVGHREKFAGDWRAHHGGGTLDKTTKHEGK